MRKRNSYTAQFKLEVVCKAQEIGNRAAGRMFNVDEKCVRRWISMKKTLMQVNRRKRANRCRNAYWPELENNLYRWVTAQRDSGRSVSTIQIRMKAKVLAAEMKIENFTGNSSWCYRFMKRKNLSVRMRTTVGQKLPDDWEEKQKGFLEYFLKLRNDGDYDLKHIINMDEVPLMFDCPPNKTVQEKNSTTVSIATTGHEKTSMTVVLACCADGSKLKPMVIFKRKTMPKDDFPTGIVIEVNEKGWMNKNVMIKWLDEVWRKRKDAFFNPKGLLILDSMKAHLDDDVKKYATKVKASLAVIPGGLTKKLQPLDISVNRSFKNHIRDQWEKWMCSGLKDYTKSGHLKKASLPEVCRWIVAAWDSVSVQTVKSGFRKPGLIQYENETVLDSDSNNEFSDSDNSNELDPEILKLFESETEESDFEGFN